LGEAIGGCVDLNDENSALVERNMPA